MPPQRLRRRPTPDVRLHGFVPHGRRAARAVTDPKHRHIDRDVLDLLAGGLGKRTVRDARRLLRLAELAHAGRVKATGAGARDGGLARGGAERELTGGGVLDELAVRGVAEGGLDADEPGRAPAAAVADVRVAGVVEGFAEAVVVGRVGADEEGEVDGRFEVCGGEGRGGAGGGPDGFLGGGGPDGVGGGAGGGRVVRGVFDAEAGVRPCGVGGVRPQGAEVEEGEVGEEDAAVGGLVRELQGEVLPAPDLVLQVEVAHVEDKFEGPVRQDGCGGAIEV